MLQPRNKVETNFSMSSMTDIIFLLLIFFVITSTLVSPNALKLNLPKSSNQVKSVTPQIAISIDENINYYVGTNRVNFSSIENILSKELDGEEKPTIKLHADNKVPIEYVVKIMNLAKKHKYRLLLATSAE